MQKEQPPKIEFPCEYPIKVMGDHSEDFIQLVIDTIAIHTDTIDESKVSTRASRNNSFLAVTVFITATGVEQLSAIHCSLQDTGRVKMVI